MFRTFAGVNRLRLQNVGLTEQLDETSIHRPYGADVEPALPDLQRRHAASQSLRQWLRRRRETTVGASRKGRIWSTGETVSTNSLNGARDRQEASCDTIDPDEVLKERSSREES